MPAQDLSVRFTRPQFKAFNCLAPGRTVFLGWGRGTGKSHFLRTVCWLRIAEWDGKLRTAMQPFKGIRIAWLMPSRKQFVDVHSAAILDELGKDGRFGFLGGKVNQASWTISFPGGSTLIPFPASDYNSQNARGVRADLVVVDECDDVGTEVYNAVAVPWLSATWSLREELLAGTPTRGRHGLWYRMQSMGRTGDKVRRGDADDLDAEQCKAFGSVFASHATYKDSPEVVSADAVAKARATTNPATFKREWEADPDAGEGLIYPFIESFHVRQPPPLQSFREFLVGMDHGWVDAGVLLLVGITGHGNDAQAWVLDEWYETECPNHVWDKRAKDWLRYGPPTFWPDPSRPDRVNTLRQLGCNVGNTDNNIHGGISRVADMLFRRKSEHGESHDWARLFVAPKCKNTIREFGLYRRKKLPDGTFSEEASDKDNHCLVAGTMVLTRRGEIPIERIAPGDKVLTRKGWCNVQWSGQTFESAPVWRLETTRGVIEGTADHRVWTENKGWVELQHLQKGDMLSAWENMEHQSPSSLTGSGTEGIRIRQTPTWWGTSAAANTCTGLCGSSITAQSRTGTTCITGTTIRSTTTSQTLSVCPEQNTCLGTSLTGRRNRRLSRSLSLIASGHSLPRGTGPTRVERGTVNTRKRSSGTGSRQQPPAVSAEIRSSRWFNDQRCAFARKPVSPPIAEQAEWTANSEAVPCVASRSPSISTAEPELAPAYVVASYPARRSEPVYDLTVDGEHEFFANGVLVHNSMDALRYAIVGRFGLGLSSRHVVSGR